MNIPIWPQRSLWHAELKICQDRPVALVTLWLLEAAQILVVLSGSWRMWVVMKYTGIIIITIDKLKGSERDVASANSAPECRQT